MNKQETPFAIWLLAFVAAVVAGLLVGGLLLGPPGAAAMAGIFGRGVWNTRRQLDDQR